MKEANIVGIDLAKEVFHVCVMNSRGRVLRRKKVSRQRLFEYVTVHGEGVVAMESCGGSHYWGRKFESVGFEVRQMAAQFVKPFVKSQKNDSLDAEAICEAASRDQMRFVSTRSEKQQEVQSVHRIRERLVKQRTALSNEIRGFLMEYGIVLPQGIAHVRRRLPSIVESHREEHGAQWAEIFTELYEELCSVDARIQKCECRLRVYSTSDEACKRLMKIDGVGYLTATAVVSAVGNPSDFKNGRDFSAWLGLVPRQTSTGGKVSLGRITKRGDKYIRKLLVQGARANARAMVARRDHSDETKREFGLTAQWFTTLAQRRGQNRALVALANKTARRIWIVLSGQEFKKPEQLLAEQEETETMLEAAA